MPIVAKEIARKYGYILTDEKTIIGKDDSFWETKRHSRRYRLKLVPTFSLLGKMNMKRQITATAKYIWICFVGCLVYTLGILIKHFAVSRFKQVSSMRHKHLARMDRSKYL